MPQHTRNAAQCRPGRRHHAVVVVALAVAGNRRVDGQAERRVAAGLAPLDEAPRHTAVLEDVDLEDLGDAADRADLLDGRRTDCGQAVRHAEPVGRPGDAGLAGGVKEPGCPRRGNHDRPVDRLAEQRRCHVDRAYVRQVRRQKLVVVERVRIAPQGPFVVRAAVDVMKYGRRQAPFGDAPEIHNLVAIADPHRGDYAV